ncbi:MAG TPA: TrbC/VirB2 family protein [Stellaceae bacterium]|nr:TrbC/VirB2 family protein [Stellaceae bacterium]
MRVDLQKLALASAVALATYAPSAFAATAGGGTLPWDTPLQTIQTDLTGSTATSLSLIGVVAIFGVLIFGGELNHFFRSICYVVLLCAVLVAGQNLLTDFGITGATTAGGHAVMFFGLAVVALVGSAAIVGAVLYRLYCDRRRTRRLAA